MGFQLQHQMIGSKCIIIIHQLLPHRVHEADIASAIPHCNSDQNIL